MPGRLVGHTHYRFTRQLATGGMGAVYEATQYGAEGFQKQVAIKTIIDSLGSDADFVEMFIGEAKLVADLVHENIIQVYQLDRTDNTLYIVMEYIDGIDLSAFMARHADVGREVPVDLAAFIVSRVCRGLDYAHKKRDGQGGLLGVVHRDVTPRNIMITGQGVVKLGDFGVAKAHKLLASREGAVLMGKAPYMSPEQADYKDTDGRSDLFSLGTVFYRLLTGVSVFKSDEVGSTLRNVIRAEVPPVTSINQGVPVELEAILMKALARNPEDRYRSAGEMGYALEYFMYHDGFGPTNVALEAYLHELLPELALTDAGGSAPSRVSVDIGDQATLVAHPDALTKIQTGG